MAGRVRAWVIGVVTSIWVLSVICTIFVDDYEPAESINAIFAAVLGGAVAYKNVGNNGDDDADS